MIAAAIIAGGVFRRVLTLRALGLASAVGVVAGLLVAGVPAPDVAADLLTPLVTVFAALVVLPLVAGLPTGDRRGGLELVVAMRPVSSLSWTAGRLLGFATGAGWLVVLAATLARLVAGAVPVPDDVIGMRVARSDDVVEWRFPLPAGAEGPFDLAFDVLMTGRPTGSVTLDVRRGRTSQLIDEKLVAQRRVRLPIPDLAPAKGDLFVTARASDGVYVGRTPATLVVGEKPMELTRLPIETSGLASLGIGLLAVLAAASAFRFETACLAGLLAVSVRVTPPWAHWVWAGVLIAMAWAGTALTRRQVMP